MYRIVTFNNILYNLNIVITYMWTIGGFKGELTELSNSLLITCNIFAICTRARVALEIILMLRCKKVKI